MSIRKELKYAIIRHIVTFPAYYLLNVYAKTISLTLENDNEVRNHVTNNGRVILASWHQRFFGGFYLPKIFDRPISIMISQSRDGDFIADVVRRIGWAPVRGSGSRGGKQALRTLVEEIKNSLLCGHIIDGPRGPARVIKPGLISLASHSGAAICPTYVFYERPWIFNSWDRFMVPKPFSRVIIRFDSLVFVPEDVDSELFEEIRSDLERNMIERYGEGDQNWMRERSIAKKS
jgi:lysophospholipid acyltransferase (LPLAT)-like uncharacterized protein